MGKGKVKGWRPPAAGGVGEGLLLGNVSHVTGDVVASPVQLRDEGRALPENHPNFGNDWKGGKGKGDRGKGGKGGSDIAAKGASAIPTVARPKEGWAANLGACDRPPLMKASAKAPAAPPPPPFEEDGRSEIQRRREAMLARERAAARQFAEGILEAAREAVALEPKEELQAELKEELECKHEDFVKEDLVKEELLDEEPLKDEEPVKEEAGKRPHDASFCKEEAAPERPLKEAKIEEKPAPAAAPALQGLQGWSQRVNALAEADVLLAKACRDFVRKRILRAHTSGDLHSIDWGAEPIPTKEELAP